MREARSTVRARALRRLSRWIVAAPLASGAILAPGQAAAQFYIGPSFIQIPGTDGGAVEPTHKGWIRAESRYWTEKPALPEIRGISAPKQDLLFTGSKAPTGGPDVLNVAIDKHSPALKPLMDKCRSGAAIPQVRFAESSEIARHPQEHGPRPRDVPAFYEYVLTGVRLVCPVVEGAPEQAIQLKFDDIRWINARAQAAPQPISTQVASLPPLPRSGATRTYAISWFAAAVDSGADSCPRMNTKPGPAEYFALIPPEKAAELRAATARNGVGPDRMPYRGPNGMDVTLMPGIVPDPGNVAPRAKVVQGFDLDGDDGSGAPPPGVRKHANFVSPDGRKGIDNQLSTVEGCVEGLRRKGFLPMIFNEGRAAGSPTALLEVSGIDDPRNDDDVWVTILYSGDGVRRSPAKVVLPDYTFRISDDPAFGQDFARLRGKIVDGVLTTAPIAQLHIHEVTGIETTFIQPRLRLQMTDDGRMKGLIGGYIDWRKRVVFQVYRSSDYENTVGLQAPAVYNAMKRAADGLQDPATGEFNGISAAFEIEGVSAFIPPAQRDAVLVQGKTPSAAARPMASAR